MNSDRQLVTDDGLRVQVVDLQLATPLQHAKAIGKQRTIDDCHEPFFVADLSAVAAQLRRWKARLPRVEPFYAVRCNDDPAVLRTLAYAGSGFECASQTELRRVIQLGVTPDRILYASPCKHSTMIRSARSSNVRLITFDNAEELYKVKQHYPEAKMVLCVLPDCAKAQCLLDNKFGAAYDSVANLINTAKSLSIDIVGVSFHVGSHCQAQSYLHALRLARRVFDDLLEAGYHPDVVDIGGGFPGNNDDAISFEEIAQVVVSSLDEYFPLASGVRIIAEPGRYMVTRAFTLMTSVIGKHVVCDFEHVNCTDEHSPRGTSGNQNASITRFSYYLSDGVYGSFNSLFFNHCSRRAGVAKSVPDTAPVFHSILFGPTFDALDCVAQDAMLPELSVGDWLYFENMGAYSLVCASEFNGMPRAARFYVINKTDVALFRHELAATIAQEGVAVSPDLLALVGEALLQVSPVSEARMKVDTSSCALLNNESAHVKCQIANCYFSTFPASVKTSSTESVDAKAVEQLEKLVDAAQSHTTTVSVTRADASRSNEPADPDSLVQEPAFTILLE